MDGHTNSYIKADDNKVINEKNIKWIKKMSECLEVCTKSNGCVIQKDTHTICKFHTPDSYNKLNGLFE
jgi:hypothetical protein